MTDEEGPKTAATSSMEETKLRTPPLPVTEEVPKTPELDEERVARVTVLPNKWHLVEYGTWSVSVGPDAVIMLPRHVSPADVTDFVGAMLAAAEVGHKIKADNEAAGAKDNRSLPSRRAIVREGGVPPGAMRMPTTAGPNSPSGSIGRRGGQRRASQPPPRGSQGFPAPRVPTQRRRGSSGK
jgi:hypothetical protein